MATYVLVHGDGHCGWCYQRVARILRANGHEVFAVSRVSGCGPSSACLQSSMEMACLGHVHTAASTFWRSSSGGFSSSR